MNIYFLLQNFMSMKVKVLCLFILFCSFSFLSWGQTILNPGDLVILGVDANLGGNPDEISFFCFKDITTGTEIQITDQGYERCYAGLWGSGEGGARLTRTGGTILAGTVITVRTGQALAPWISFTYPDTLWTVANLGSGAPTNNFNLNSGGDQVYFAQGGTWGSDTACSNHYPGPGGRMLFAFSTSGSWISFGNSTQKSGLYPGMSCYNMAPTIASDFVKYSGPLTAATQKDWISRINTVSNWTKYTTSALYLAAAPDLHTKVIPIIPGTDADWTIPNPDTICQTAASINLSTLISGLGLPGGTWSGSGVTGNTFSPSGLNGTYNITYTNDCPCCISQTHTITVNPSLTVTVPSNIAICNNGTVATTNFITNPAGGTFTWTNNNTTIGLVASGSGNINSFTATNTGISPVIATITVTPVTTCLGIPSSYTITVNPTPTVTVPANITVCNGGTVTATVFASTPSGGAFTWTNSNTAIGLAASGSGNINSFTATNNSSSPIISTITVIPTVNTCSGTPSSYTITVNPTPTVTVPTNITVCNGGTVTANAFASIPSGGNFTWVNSNTTIGLTASGSGNISSFTATNNGLSSIVSTITVTPIVNTCSGTPSSFTITVNPTPTVTVPTNITVCNGGTVTANAFASIPSGGNFTWANSNTAIGLTASGSGNISSFTATNNSLSSIISTITVTPTVNTCSGTPSSFTITVNPTPTVTVPANITVCNGGTVTATVFASTPSGGNFTWVNSNTAIGLTASGSGNITGFTATNNGSSPIISTITVTPNVNTCIGTPSTYTITVNPTPTVSASPNVSLCNNGTVAGTSFTSSTVGALFSWTNSNTTIGLAASGSGNISSFTATNSTSSPVIAIITVTPTANTCSGTSSNYTITVNPSDNPAFNYNPTALCQSGADVAANITGGSTGTFTSSPAGLLFMNNTTGLIDVSASLVNTYIITFNTSTCPSSATDTINITAAPSADFNYSGSFCPEDTNPLPVLEPGAIAGIFSAVPAGLVFVNASTGEVNLESSTPGTYTVTNTIAASGGCAQVSENSFITINPVPNATASSNSAVCEGQTLNLASSGGSLFIWSGPDGFTSTAQNPAIANLILSDAGLYTVTVTNSYGCSSTAQTTVVINTNPTATISGNSGICVGQTLNLNSGGGTAFNWSGPDNFTSILQNPSITHITSSSSGTYTVIVANALGCSDTADISIVINPLPIVSINGLANAYCVDANPITLTGTPTGGIFSGLGVAGNTFYPSQAGIGGPYELIYSYTDANTCINSDTVLVSVNALPVVNLQSDPSSQFYTGQVVTLTATPSNYSNYNFYIGSNAIQSGISNTYQSVSFVNGDMAVVVATENGCQSADSLLLDVKPFPNAFTPNGNGDDDVFLKGLDLKIINRWGQQLYSGKEGWDGTYKTQKVSEGTYYYIVTLIDIDKSIKTLTGSVNVVNPH